MKRSGLGLKCGFYIDIYLKVRRSDTVHLIIRLNDAIRYHSYIFSLKSLKILKPDRYASNIWAMLSNNMS